MSKGFLFALVALASLAMGSALTYQVLTDREQQRIETENVFLQEVEVFDFICQTLTVNCSQVPFPVVTYTDTGDDWGSYDKGTAQIYVDENIRGTNLGRGILAHEMLHYFQWIARNETYETKITDCANEKASHEMALLYANKHGFKDPNLYTWDQVKLSYNCF